MSFRAANTLLDLQEAELVEFARTADPTLPIAPEHLPGVVENLRGLQRHIRIVTNFMGEAPAAAAVPPAAFAP